MRRGKVLLNAKIETILETSPEKMKKYMTMPANPPIGLALIIE